MANYDEAERHFNHRTVVERVKQFKTQLQVLLKSKNQYESGRNIFQKAYDLKYLQIKFK